MSCVRLRRTVTLVIITAVIVGVAAACVPSGERDAAVVFAAASLADAFDAMAVAFEGQTGQQVVISAAGSSSLREQILDGAPADVFASANVAVMNAIVDAGLVVDEPTVFAANRLVLAVPIGNPAQVVGLDDVGRSDLIVGLCARDVPCGELARSVLDDVGVVAAPDTEEPDVRALTAKIAAGEIDVGLVYASDALSSPDVDIVDTGRQIVSTVDYPIAVLDGGDHVDVARDFVAFVTSAQGRAVVRRFGFETP